MDDSILIPHRSDKQTVQFCKIRTESDKTSIKKHVASANSLAYDWSQTWSRWAFFHADIGPNDPTNKLSWVIFYFYYMIMKLRKGLFKKR
jgi:hypothetical protein